jgi:hypothetical protein
MEPTQAGNLERNLANLDAAADPLLRQVLETAVDSLAPTVASDVLFTDERAPLETIVDALVIRYLLEQGPAGLPTIGG